jgi:hypothetical protein
MAYKLGNIMHVYRKAKDTPENTRITEQRKEFLDFVQQYVLLEDNGCLMDTNRIEDELGLDYGQINSILAQAQKAVQSTSSWPAGTLLAMLYGMWAVQTKWEHIEEKPIVVTD